MKSPKTTKRDPVHDSTTLRGRLGYEIQRRRLSSGMTQFQLSELSDLSPKYVGEIERGEANPTLEAVESMAAVVGWDASEIFRTPQEPITEGVRRKLVADLTEILPRLLEQQRWLEALSPEVMPIGRPTIPTPQPGEPRPKIGRRRTEDGT